MFDQTSNTFSNPPWARFMQNFNHHTEEFPVSEMYLLNSDTKRKKEIIIIFFADRVFVLWTLLLAAKMCSFLPLPCSASSFSLRIMPFNNQHLWPLCLEKYTFLLIRTRPLQLWRKSVLLLSTSINPLISGSNRVLHPSLTNKVYKCSKGSCTFSRKWFDVLLLCRFLSSFDHRSM